MTNVVSVFRSEPRTTAGSLSININLPPPLFRVWNQRWSAPRLLPPLMDILNAACPLVNAAAPPLEGPPIEVPALEGATKTLPPPG